MASVWKELEAGIKASIDATRREAETLRVGRFFAPHFPAAGRHLDPVALAIFREFIPISVEWDARRNGHRYLGINPGFEPVAQGPPGSPVNNADVPDYGWTVSLTRNGLGRIVGLAMPAMGARIRVYTSDPTIVAEMKDGGLHAYATELVGTFAGREPGAYPAPGDASYVIDPNPLSFRNAPGDAGRPAPGDPTRFDGAIPFVEVRGNPVEAGPSSCCDPFGALARYSVTITDSDGVVYLCESSRGPATPPATGPECESSEDPAPPATGYKYGGLL